MGTRLGRVASSAVAVGAALGAAVLVVEAWLATRREYLPASSAPALDREYPDGGNLVRLTILGDSTAAGVGLDDANDTVGGQLAAKLADEGHPIALSGSAIAGSGAGDLGPQVSRALLRRSPDVAVILVGADDATRGRGLRAVRRDLAEAVRRLRETGARVVVGTCPDLGAAPAFVQPLRTVLGWRARAVARAQAASTRAAGGEPVDLGALTGPVFRADPGTFSADGYHPSADGYRLIADALLPAALRAASAPASL